jgi:hypothetical protein
LRLNSKVLLVALGLVFLSACSQAEPGVSLEEKEFNYFRCLETLDSKGWGEEAAKRRCLSNLD